MVSEFAGRERPCELDGRSNPGVGGGREIPKGAVAPTPAVWFDGAIKSRRLANTSAGDDAQRIQVTGSARISGWLNLAATDEKDLSTTQSPTQTNARISRPYGYAGRPQGAETPAEQGPQTARDFDSAEAAGLTKRFGFSAAHRLHRRGEYLGAQRGGVRFQTAHFVIYAHKAQTAMTRLGVTVSRRIGNAVVRNRVKRRVRECFRLSLRTALPEGTDLIVIARDGAGDLASGAILGELATAIAGARKRSGAW
jgi:ribonuclease P protein component